jgi:hypothetical protein
VLTQYNPLDIEFALRTTSPVPPFPPATDREAWERIATGLGKQAVAEVIAQAEADAQSSIPALPATLYLEFQRTGQREGYQDPVRRRRRYACTWNRRNRDGARI